MARGTKRTIIETKICERCSNGFPRNRKYSDAQWRGTRYCSAKCRSAWNKGLTKYDDPRLMTISESVRISAIGRPSWSKGLTKETHPTLAIISRKISETQKGRPCTEKQRAALSKGWAWGKGRTKESCPKVAARGKCLSKLYTGRQNPAHSVRMQNFYAVHPEKHPNSIVGRKTKGHGYTHIERIVADILTDFGIEYAFNVRIGTKWPDFSITSHMLIIEADGEHWHQDVEKEVARDAYLNSLGWRVLHLTGKSLVNETDNCRALISDALERCRGAR